MYYKDTNIQITVLDPEPNGKVRSASAGSKCRTIGGKYHKLIGNKSYNRKGRVV